MEPRGPLFDYCEHIYGAYLKTVKDLQFKRCTHI
jgi:hypothetical protein